ncbi:dihydrolipoamide acetyltransferase family protein [Halalkalibacter alkalisediminis]|uniref:Dihydrolipoamide acetyltransferase component of pyruvate dehydrogenase complex n=1 Tax=Halalkalibacter alkalisediminis TaxID=935616 RepID=A0ABV6NLC9_9BACI|nr:dihydrolipoamide acetyltransferase family protein [Halalkalibacter alkalisediminis]
MATKVIMPKLGLSMKEGTVSIWSKQEGDEVKKGEPIADINSEKLEKEIEAPVDGTIIKISVPEGHGVPPGTVICYIGEKGEAVAEDQPTASSNAEVAATTAIDVSPQPKKIVVKTNVKISPVAKKMAESAGLDIASIKGTGPKGRITKEDVEKAIDTQSASCQVNEESNKEREQVEIIPISGMRKVIAQRMQASLQNAAQLTINMKVDVTDLIILQKQMTDVAEKQHDTKLTVTDFIARSVVLALHEHKQMNSKLSNNEIHVYSRIHLGMAVALDKGLVVPVIRHAQTLSLIELSKRIKELATRSREGTLSTDEMSGSTFTITNLGALGIDHFTPILNVGETGILGVGAIEEVAKFVGDDIQRRRILPLSLTFDHQILDGTPAAEFLLTVRRNLEEPTRMFL